VILVIGGTGTTGRAVLEALPAAHLPFRALVRPGSEVRLPAGTAAVQGDAGDAAGLRRALGGVDQVFLAMANGPRQEGLELGIVRAAAAAGVGHLVKVSAPVVGPDVPVAVARMHDRVERAALAAGAESGMTCTFLRPYAFQQNLLSHAATIRTLGVFFGITGDTPLNMVDARDVADVAVTVMQRPGHRGQPLTLTGPEAVSYPEVARRLSLLARRVRYVDQSPEQLRHGLRQRAGLPGWLADHIVEIQELALAVPEVPSDSVARITGRAPRRLDDFLRENVRDLCPPRRALPVARLVAHRSRRRRGTRAWRPDRASAVIAGHQSRSCPAVRPNGLAR
jgi:uncharacterized protein YbjT (DUF2867 family)